MSRGGWDEDIRRSMSVDHPGVAGVDGLGARLDLPYRHGMPVPWVTRWTEENVNGDEAVYSIVWSDEHERYEVAYPVERPGDRDERGVLWQRCRDGMPIEERGEPEWSQLHPHRHREAVTNLLCQICGGSTETPTLWLLPKIALPDDGSPIATTNPPVCGAHSTQPPVWCPALRRFGTVLLSVTGLGPMGYYGEGVTIHQRSGRISRWQSVVMWGHEEAEDVLPLLVAKQQVVTIETYRVERVWPGGE